MATIASRGIGVSSAFEQLLHALAQQHVNVGGPGEKPVVFGPCLAMLKLGHLGAKDVELPIWL